MNISLDRRARKLSEHPREIGLHAIGTIDRTIYHGAFPEGTVIRFEAFEVWGK